MEQRISIERMEQAVNLFGSFDENVRLIESEFKVTISNREGELRVNGEVEDTMLAVKALNALLTISNRGEPITEQNVRYVISLVRAGQEDRISELTGLRIDPYFSGTKLLWLAEHEEAAEPAPDQALISQEDPVDGTVGAR